MNNLRMRYQVKKSGTDNWVEVSEKIFMETLADRFDTLTPVLSKILQGEQIITPHEIFRRIN